MLVLIGFRMSLERTIIFEIVGQDLYIKESILNVPMNELQIHIKVNVQVFEKNSDNAF